MSVLCKLLEAILKHWLCFSKIDSNFFSYYSLSSSFKRTVEAVSVSQSVATPQGRGRLFIRAALKAKCLHVPVETIVSSLLTQVN